jgi:DNA-binding LacI/PurR family transcriptional regulator
MLWGMANNRPITAAEIARRLNVSRTTVSLVLSGRAKDHRIAEGTARRIRAMAEALQYAPNAAARQLAGKRSNSIGVLVTNEMMPDLGRVSGAPGPRARLVETMEVLAATRGIRFIVGHVVTSAAQLHEYLEDFRARGVDGLFSLVHHDPRYRETVTDLLRFDNVVFYEKPVDDSGATPSGTCSVGPDFVAVGRMGTQHLIDRGRRRIGLVFREMLFPYAIQRREGYVSALQSAGHRVDDQLTWVMTEQTQQRWTAPFTPEMALQAVDDLVISRGVDGILAVNDLYAGSLLCALRKRGLRVPEDVAVIGCDNLEFGPLMQPSITTIDFRLESMAQSLVGMMFDLLDDRRIPTRRRAVLIQPELIVRGSS